jgi:predicted tellurium resistance membrane protein TerC
MQNDQVVLFQGNLADPVLWTVAVLVFLLGVTNFLALLLVVRRLPSPHQLAFAGFGLALGVGLQMAWQVFGLFEWQQNTMLILLGSLLMFLGLSSFPSFRQTAMPSYRRRDFWMAVFWTLVVDLAFTQLSAISTRGISEDFETAISAGALGYSLSVLVSWFLYLNASRIRGMVFASCWLVGTCGLRMLVEGLDGGGLWDFRSTHSVATRGFWILFLLGLVSALFMQPKRKFQLPLNHSGKANFLLRR